MVSRICPHCGATRYSAAAELEWTCPECGAKIPPPGPPEGVRIFAWLSGGMLVG